jgi:2-phospho-L-lactate guanylyltransferase
LFDVTIGIPIKPFLAAKRRLADILDHSARTVLSRRLAARTVEAVVGSGARPLVLSADDTVTQWARALGVDVLLDEGSSLDQAAHMAVSRVRQSNGAWAILHADLPVLTAAHLSVPVATLAAGVAVLAPSSDGGTSLVGSVVDHFPFAYGVASFHRHLASMAALTAGEVCVVTNLGLLLDLDTPDDLAAAAGTADGAWLAR